MDGVDARRQRRWAFERAYPLAKQLAEVLELEDEALARVAKDLRARIGVELSSVDGR